MIIRNEERVDSLVKHYDKSLDRSNLDGTNKEGWLMDRARDLEKSADELRRKVDRRDKWEENRHEVENCLKIAFDKDKDMKNRKYGSGTENIWAKV